LPDNVDAIYLGVGGTDAINFLNQYQQPVARPKLIGGTIMADQTVLSSKGQAKDALVGTPTVGSDSPTITRRRNGQATSRPIRTRSRRPEVPPRRRCSASATMWQRTGHDRSG
jgi:hypothetical protein